MARAGAVSQYVMLAFFPSSSAWELALCHSNPYPRPASIRWVQLVPGVPLMWRKVEEGEREGQGER